MARYLIGSAAGQASPPPPPPPGYTCGGVVFDGATDCHLASLTASDSGVILFSHWVYVTVDQANINMWCIDPAASDSVCGIGLSGGAVLLRNYFGNTDGSVYFSFNNNSTATPGVWLNMLGKAKTDLAEGMKIAQLYVNDTDVLANVDDTTGGSFTMSFSGKQVFIGQDGFDDFLTANLADVYIAPGQDLDLSITANRRKFIDGSGKPVSLGADGSIPTGTAPAIFLSIPHGGTPANFANNLGTGGNFTVSAGTTQTGALVNTSADVVMADVTGITVGAFITATGVTAGTTVLSIDTLTVTMSAPATASNPTASMQFGGVLRLAPSSPSD